MSVVMHSHLDRLMDRLVVERSVDPVIARLIEAVLRTYDATIQSATVENLLARPMSFRITPAECDATAKRIIASRNAASVRCGRCDGSGWEFIAGVDITDRGEVTPCHQCQRERAAGWRAEQAAYRATWKTTTVDVLVGDERRAADDERDRVVAMFRRRHDGAR